MATEFSPEQKDKYRRTIKVRCCPVCNSTKVMQLNVNTTRLHVWIYFQCPACGQKWEEVFAYETINPINPKGKMPKK